MTFDWDTDKNIQNFWKHGIDFNDVTALFFQPGVYRDVSRVEDLEWRRQLLGNLGGQLIAVIFKSRSDEIRLISARRASKRERILFRFAERRYYQEISHER